jgi:hypothetical protein
MSDTNKPADQAPEAEAMAISEFCPRDGSVLVEGVKFGYQAWVCPMCTYWKLRTT